jgi:hypothetical protein
MLQRLIQPNLVRRSMATPIGGGVFVSAGRLSGVRVVSAGTPDTTTITVSFTACVTVVTVADVQVQIDGGAWQDATDVSGSPGNVLTFTVPEMAPGDVVVIQGLDGALTDCATPAEDIDAWIMPVENTLIMPGDFMLLESGQNDVVLLEDAAPDDGLLMEDAT